MTVALAAFPDTIQTQRDVLITSPLADGDALIWSAADDAFITTPDFLTVGEAEDLFSPPFADDEAHFYNVASPTKQARISAAGITAGQTRVFTLPDRSGIVATLEGDQTFTDDISIGGTLTLSGAPTQDLHAATKLYVDTAVAVLVESAPGTLDTLNELAAALGDDPNFATTVTNSIATRAAASVTLTAGNGLTGGGDLSANRTFAVGAGVGIAVGADDVALDINGLTAEATIDGADFVAIYDVTAGALRKMTRTNFVAGLGGANPAGSGSELQYRSSGTAFAALTGSSASGANLTLGGNLTVDTNTLFVDATNDRVGVGTTSPGERLAILAPNNSINLLSMKIFGQSHTAGFYVDDTEGLLIYASFTGSAAKPIRLFSGGAVGDEQLRTTSVGVSIGVASSPQGQLEVRSKSASRTALWVESLADSTVDTGLLSKKSNATNSISNIFTLAHNTSGTPAAGFGGGLKFALESTTTESQEAAQIASLWNVATHASRSADLVVSLVHNGTALAQALRIKSDTRLLFGVPNSAPTDADIANNFATIFIDQSTNELKVRVRYSDGSYKTFTGALV